jgi:deoxyribodipyrimidine photo-lyase
MLSIVWFKRDLRWVDHQPLKEAIAKGTPIFPLFIIEPSLLQAPDYSNRHWKFMLECANELKNTLKDAGADLLVLEGEVKELFSEIQNRFGTFQLFSHAETGNMQTFQRDLEVKQWCKENGVQWNEYFQHAVTRGRQSRNGWNKHWEVFMNAPLDNPVLTKIRYYKAGEELFNVFPQRFVPQEESPEMQVGGRSKAIELLSSFLNNRVNGYSRSISKPAESRSHCSRLSPHLAWGSISIREVVQSTAAMISAQPRNRNLQNFMSRLHWHCHFIQKLESEPRMEFENQNSAYDKIRDTVNSEYFVRWSTGKTGVPLVDACMRCVNETGYLNFRMRAMLVSFWTHHLQQPWQASALHLARQFLDYEPGIHYPQHQMQAGTVGYHTLRVYNPQKQAEDHDHNAAFIKKWVPELRDLPSHFAIAPWRMTPMEAMMEGFELGVDYPKPICDLEAAARFAKDQIFQIKKSQEARRIAHQISEVHVNKK